jgi:ribosomal protein L21
MAGVAQRSGESRQFRSGSLALLACAAGALLSLRCDAPSAFTQPMPEANGATARRGSTAADSATAMEAYTTAKLATPPPCIYTEKQTPYVETAEHLSYAVAEYGGAQHIIVEGRMYEAKFIRALAGSKVRLNRILLDKRKGEDGEFEVTVGQPWIEGAYAEITILEHLKGDEKIMYKRSIKKHYQRRYWIHDKITRFRVDKIVFDKDADYHASRDSVPGESAFPMRMKEGIGAPPGAKNWDPDEAGIRGTNLM